MLGSPTPRLATAPARDLADPAASLGHEVIAFADLIGMPLDPWQREAVIRGLELTHDGRLRWRKVLLLVARQNGKTTLLTVLALWWLAIDLWRTPRALVLGTSTKLDTAHESWEAAVALAETSEHLRPLIPRNGIRRANGEQTLMLGTGRYKISAATALAGRGTTLRRAILDELREHTTYAAWDAVIPAMGAVHGAQVWALSNAGGDHSVVLNDLRLEALKKIQGTSASDDDDDLALIEWSAPDEADPLDVKALAAANPTLGGRMPLEPLLADARRAVSLGGEVLAGFRTERMCQRVQLLDPAIDAADWARLGPPAVPAVPLTGALRARLALAWDVSPDGLHATLYAAATDADGLVHLDPVQAWAGPKATKELRSALPALTERIRPTVVGWLPSGPGAALAADLAERKGRRRWPPPGVRVEAVRAEVTQVCMGMAELVRTGGIHHSGDPLLTAQIGTATRGRRGDAAWVFARPADGWVDALYAAAAAAHLARTMPTPLQVTEVLTVPRRHDR